MRGGPSETSSNGIEARRGRIKDSPNLVTVFSAFFDPIYWNSIIDFCFIRTNDYMADYVDHLVGQNSVYVIRKKRISILQMPLW